MASDKSREFQAHDKHIIVSYEHLLVTNRYQTCCCTMHAQLLSTLLGIIVETRNFDEGSLHLTMPVLQI